MSKDPNADTRPLVVCDEGGAFLFLASTNKKGYAKSLEQGALWVVHPETDRLLPTGKEAPLRRIEDREEYYYAEVSVSDSMSPGISEPLKEEGLRDADAKPAAEAAPDILTSLSRIVKQRKKDLPEGSYTTHLFTTGIDKIRKKTGEEAVELILAHKPEEIIYEAADLIYHLIVLLEAENIGIDPVLDELSRRGK